MNKDCSLKQRVCTQGLTWKHLLIVEQGKMKMKKLPVGITLMIEILIKTSILVLIAALLPVVAPAETYPAGTKVNSLFGKKYIWTYKGLSGIRLLADITTPPKLNDETEILAGIERKCSLFPLNSADSNAGYTAGRTFRLNGRPKVIRNQIVVTLFPAESILSISGWLDRNGLILVCTHPETITVDEVEKDFSNQLVFERL